MSIFRLGRLWAILVPLLLLLVTTTQVWAADPVVLELQMPEQATLGDEVEVTALLRDASGRPVPRATIILWNSSEFLSVGGAITLGEAMTDAQGRVVFSYEARTEESITLNAYFPGDSRYSGAQASAEMSVQGSAQLYQSTAGIQVPGLGVWLLVGLLGIVWTIFLVVMVFLALIVRAGSTTSSASGGINA